MPKSRLVSGEGIAAPLPLAVRIWTGANAALPFVASLLLHLAVILIGMAAVQVVRSVAALVTHEQIVVPDIGEISTDPVGGILHPGPTDDSTTDVAQLNDPNTEQVTGLNTHAGHDLTAALSAGSTADPGETLGIAGVVRGVSGKTGGSVSNGAPGDGGALAPFGVPGGSSAGPRSVFCCSPSRNVRRIAFVCDASGSMMSKFDLLRVELRRAIEMLRVPQSFSVIFFQETTCSASDPQLLVATPDAKRRAYDFIDRTAARSGTDPIPGIRLAFQQGAELIYLLTDGDFPDNTAVIAELRKLNPTKKVKINTLAFIDRDESYEKVLKQIALENGGAFRYVSEADLER